VLENFIRYSKEVKQKGAACDIAKLASALNARAKELLFGMSVDYVVTNVDFSSSRADEDVKRVFGHLAVDVQGMRTVFLTRPVACYRNTLLTVFEIFQAPLSAMFFVQHSLYPAAAQAK